MRRRGGAASTSTTPAARSRALTPYSELRDDALVVARRFIALGIKPGDRIALVAETGPEFAAAFFGAVYAGAWPVPLPLPTSFGGREAYVDQLAVQLKSCDPALFLYPPELADFCTPRGWPRRRHRRAAGTRSRRSTPRPATCRPPTPTTSPIFNIPAARPASRTASRSPTARCSTTSIRTAFGLEVIETDRVHFVAAVVS